MPIFFTFCFLLAGFLLYSSLTASSASILKVVIGTDAYFSWKLFPKPSFEEDLIVILNNRNETVLSMEDGNIVPGNIFNGRVFWENDTKFDTVRFSIKRTISADAGQYYASYTEGQFKGQHLILLGRPNKPRIQILSNISFRQSLRFSCSAKSTSIDFMGNLKMEYIWKVGKIVQKGQNSSSFIYGPVTIKDVGKSIVCEAFEIKQLLSDESEPYLINVSYRKPNVIEMSEPVKNTTLRLNCSINHNVIHEYHWKLNNKSVPQLSRYRQNGSLFNISKIDSDDNGTDIRCRVFSANEGFSSFSDAYTINMFFGPENVTLSTSQNVYYMENTMNVSDITCRAECNPMCENTWHKIGNQETLSRNLLSLKNFTLNILGQYYCTSENKYGSKISATVTVKLKEMFLNETASCMHNSSIIMDCKVDNAVSNFSYLSWEHERGGMFIQSIEGIITDNTNHLVIQHCSYLDAGTYHCRISHSGSVISARTLLNVYGAPFVIDVIKNIANGELSASIAVQFYSFPEPERTIWFHNSKEITNRHKFEHSMGKTNSTQTINFHNLGTRIFEAMLLIRDFTDKDYGLYSVVIRNQHGQTHKDILLSISALANKSVENLPILLISLPTGAVALCAMLVMGCIIYIRRQRRKQKIRSALNLLKMRQLETDLKRLEKDKRHTSSDVNKRDMKSSIKFQESDTGADSSNTTSYDDIVAINLETSNFKEAENSSYEDLKRAPNPSYDIIQNGEDDINGLDVIKGCQSDVESNMADDEISTSNSE